MIQGFQSFRRRASSALTLLVAGRGINVVFQNGPDSTPKKQQNKNNEDSKNTSSDDSNSAPKLEYDPLITVNLGYTTLNEAFNSILRTAGLKAVRNGNTLIVGRYLSGDALGLTSRTVRLNQANSSAAADALNRLGANIVVVYLNNQLQSPQLQATPGTNASSTGNGFSTLTADQIQADVRKRQIDAKLDETRLRGFQDQVRLNEGFYEREPFSKVISPPEAPGVNYPLRGLTVTTDTRLNQVTVVGPSDVVNLALGYLQQLDLRKRQVQLNVKVIDLNLNDLNELNTSFSFRVGDTFITNTNGVLGVTTGGAVPTLTNQVLNPLTLGNTSIPGTQAQSPEITATLNSNLSPTAATLKLPSQPILVVPPKPFGGAGQITDGAAAGAVLPNPAYPAAPFLLQPNFLGALQAAITNKNAKVLTDPTLVVQEGESSNVRVTEKIISYLNCTQSGSSGNTPIATATPVLDDVGLKLGLSVDRIDDNGFVTIQVNPDLSAPISVQNLGPCVTGGANQIVTLTQNRQTNSGKVRLRDGQSLVLSGVIQDFQRTFEVKFPLLGDLPIFGPLFRSTSNERDRREIIVVVTPRIVDDTDLARFGYNTSMTNPR